MNDVGKISHASSELVHSDDSLKSEHNSNIALLEGGDSKYCSKGHKMGIFHESQYNGRRVSCDTCGKKVEVEEGHYHCLIDKEDYHKGCGYLNEKEAAEAEIARKAAA